MLVVTWPCALRPHHRITTVTVWLDDRRPCYGHLGRPDYTVLVRKWEMLSGQWWKWAAVKKKVNRNTCENLRHFQPRSQQGTFPWRGKTRHSKNSRLIRATTTAKKYRKKYAARAKLLLCFFFFVPFSTKPSPFSLKKYIKLWDQCMFHFYCLSQLTKSNKAHF